MSKHLQRSVANIQAHLAVGNKMSAKKLASFLMRSAKTDAAYKKIVEALKPLELSWKPNQNQRSY